MQFTITISGEGPELADALITMRSIMDDRLAGGSVSADIVTSDKPKRTTGTKPEASAPAQTAAKAAEQPEETPAAAAAADPAGNADPGEPIPDVVQLRAVAAEKGKTPEGKKAVKALLDKFECSNISSVPDDKRAAFLKELEAIQ